MEKKKVNQKKNKEDKSKKIVDDSKRKLGVRQGRITREYNRLIKLFNMSSKEKQHVIKKLCARASFLLILSEDIEKEINSDNLTVLTINASQQFTKANPLMKDYRDTVKSYQTVIKQLCDLTKNDNATRKNDPDELEEFLNT
ncbi:MAG: hypothetical protein IJI58_05695 [Bacilli bacterium]|nr:hypothetical protein [Bacilli bacterium]